MTLSGYAIFWGFSGLVALLWFELIYGRKLRAILRKILDNMN